MFCKYCASQITDDAAFCSKCGKAANEDMAAAQKRQERRKRVATLSAYAAFTIAIGILSCLCLRNARAADSAARRAEEAYQMAYDTRPKDLTEAVSHVLAQILYDNCLRNGITSVQIGNDIIAIEPYRDDGKNKISAAKFFEHEMRGRSIEVPIKQKISNRLPQRPITTTATTAKAVAAEQIRN